MADPRSAIWAARASLKTATREAQNAWNAYTEQEDKRNPPTGKFAHGIRGANRAHAASHLPEDIRALLGIDRYGAHR